MQEVTCSPLWTHFRCDFPVFLDALLECEDSHGRKTSTSELKHPPGGRGVSSVGCSPGLRGPGSLFWEVGKESPSNEQRTAAITCGQTPSLCALEPAKLSLPT